MNLQSLISELSPQLKQIAGGVLLTPVTKEQFLQVREFLLSVNPHDTLPSSPTCGICVFNLLTKFRNHLISNGLL